MKRNIYCFILWSLTIASCGSYKSMDNYYIDHPTDRNQCFFIVDTIDIADPVIVREKGTDFIVSKKVLEERPKSIKDLSRISDVYILEYDPFFFYRFLSSKDIQRFQGINISFYTETEDIVINEKMYKRFKSTNISFVLGLVKTYFYNTEMRNACNEWFMIKDHDYKNSYYRIVYPILRRN